MNEIKKLNEGIYALKMPYEDVYTTVFAVMTDEGALLFDCGSYDSDITDSVLPMLRELNINSEQLRAVFISHSHSDHAGGLSELLKHFPSLPVYSRSEIIEQKFGADAKIIHFEDGEELLGTLRAVTLPGHTKDSSALLDTRTGSLITGDSLQLYGLFGSGLWGANVPLPDEYFASIDKLATMPEIVNVYTAHDYHPYGSVYEGRAAVSLLLSASREPILRIKRLIEDTSELSDAEIAALYSDGGRLPALGPHVVSAVRSRLKKGAV
ncbi:MAG: MBL fold metallo-hydrolase [Clostridia bacterium]|nr:MBL fold metallo-hydrolase [Clostridia bacterium]